MRQIKFRAWNKENKIMVYKDEDLSSDYWDGAHCSDVEMVNFRLADSDEYEWMQYTGLTDKNGKEIYEGDIVVGVGYIFFDKGKPNYRASVEWCGAGMCTVLHCVNPDKRGISDGIADSLEDGERFEVIGNIYENPELIDAPSRPKA